MTAVWLVLLLGSAPASRPADTRPAEAECPSAWDVAGLAIDIARRAPAARFMPTVGLAAIDHRVARATDNDAWIVTFLRDGRAVFRARVDDEALQVTEYAFLDGDRDAGTPGAAIDAALDHPPLADYLMSHRQATLDPYYEAISGRWRVNVLYNQRAVGAVWVRVTEGRRRGVLVSEGPWTTPQSRLDRLRAAAVELGPALSTQGLYYLCVALFLLVCIDWRRLLSWRTADALALAALLPAVLALKSWNRLSLILMWAVALYLVVRTLVRGLRRSGAADGDETAANEPGRWPAVGSGWLAAFLVAVFAWQSVRLPVANWRACDHAGVVAGAQFFSKGTLPYDAWRNDGLDTYGPFHYLLFGLTSRAYPVAVDAPGMVAEDRELVPRMDGAAVVMTVFVIVTAVGLVLAGRRSFGRWAPGFALALAFGLARPALTQVSGGAHLFPAAFVLLGLAAFGSPVASGALLAMATATLWFPAFLFPLWLGAHRGRGSAGRFLIAYALVLAVLLVPAFLGAPSITGRAVDLFKAGFQRQEPVARTQASGWDYGIGWALWMPRAVASVVRLALLGGYLALCVVLFFRPRAKSWFAVVNLTAALLAGTQLWKATHGGEYIAWYLPVMLLALFGSPPQTLSGSHNEPAS